MSSPQKANGSRGRARMRSRPDHDGPARDTFAVRPDKVAVAVPPAHDLFGLAVVGFDEAEFVALVWAIFLLARHGLDALHDRKRSLL